MDADRLLALEATRGFEATPANVTRALKAAPELAVRWAFEQWQLRKRAKDKFERAAEMWFVAEAMEQATHERIAAYHAALFPIGVPVADLTVGIGGDLIALARRGPTLGFELDSERLTCAKHNLRVHSVEAPLTQGDSLAGDWDFEYAFADPARRVEGRRTLEPNDFSPSPVVLAERMRGLRLGVMKLTPLLADRFLEELASSVRFLSYGGECREALLLMGSEATPERMAVHVQSGAVLRAQDAGPGVQVPQEYLYDADPAAVRAHALGSVCTEANLSPLGDSIGYLTGGHVVQSPWLRGYRVLYSGKADDKTTARALRDLKVSVAEVKQRGVHLDPAPLLKRFRGEGRPVSLVLYPVGRSVRHLLAETLP